MSYISTDSDVKDPRFGSAWRADRGAICAAVYLGSGATFLSFDSPADARAVAAACIEAAEAMERLAEEGEVLVGEAPGPGVRCQGCGALPDEQCGEECPERDPGPVWPGATP